jgi:hypothetical protein
MVLGSTGLGLHQPVLIGLGDQNRRRSIQQAAHSQDHARLETIDIDLAQRHVIQEQVIDAYR